MADADSMEQFVANSCLFGGSSSYLETLYETYLTNPDAVPAEWRTYFEQLPNVADGVTADVVPTQIREEFIRIAKTNGKSSPQLGADGLAIHQVRKQGHVFQLIDAYRAHGHHHAKLDPLGVERPSIPDLDLCHHGLSYADLDSQFATNSFLGAGKSQTTLRELFAALNETYCGSIGIEYMHITDTEQTHWLQQRIELGHGRKTFSTEEKRDILKFLNAAEGLEKYLGSKYVGQKRFSLEGAESLIPMLSDMIQRAGTQGVKELVVGMAHRGRLNVLVNVLGKSPQDLFHEFEGKLVDEGRSGDVKYHLGFSSDVQTPGGVIHLALGFNPSHLEIISPVIEGSVRARQERRVDNEHSQVVPVVIHGDAAFAGQGVVMETFNMSQARGYRTGGTIHIIINNQIGFTTSNPLDARSTLYCTDIAKMVQAPILHVNGDDPEAVVFAAQLAFDFRMAFGKDVVLDLVCYRRHGHNESDEPSITQPLMYQKIRQHQSVLALYGDKLAQAGIINADHLDKLSSEYRDTLDAGEAFIALVKDRPLSDYSVDWSKYQNQDWDAVATTQVSHDVLQKVGERLHQLPEGFVLQKQVQREIDNRNLMLAGEMPLNWGCAETLAYATLLDEGYGVRISGQDSGRGTFSHRHAVLHDYDAGLTYTPLQHVSPEQAHFTVIDSVLSEEAVLAFEYGYSTAEPANLVIWEAQFGDFANGAQVVIDQFISSGYQKWGRLCGLVLLLPHGYEGMGPEHSSARLERFLQLCAQHNMQVCVPSTPAQCFHMLRRQMCRPLRKPLIVMTPKSLLRHKLATSSLEDLTAGQFHLVIPEIDDLPSKQVTRVVLCSGKVYYDLLQQRRDSERKNVAIIRVEQLYPFPKEELKALLAEYAHAKDVVWCQEEPQNQGAWYSTQHNIQAALAPQQRLHYAGREASASPAVGYAKVHQREQAALVQQALGDE